MKKNNIVRCTNAEHALKLTKGGIYQVDEVNNYFVNGDGKFVKLVFVAGDWYLQSRFTLDV